MNSLLSHDAVTRRARTTAEAPSSDSRLLLMLLIGGETREAAKAHLGALLRSPLGVYVTHTDVAGDQTRAQLDIAAEDLDFTLHLLMSIVPDAQIGPATSRTPAWRVH